MIASIDMIAPIDMKTDRAILDAVYGGIEKIFTVDELKRLGISSSRLSAILGIARSTVRRWWYHNRIPDIFQQRIKEIVTQIVDHRLSGFDEVDGDPFPPVDIGSKIRRDGESMKRPEEKRVLEMANSGKYSGHLIVIELPSGNYKRLFICIKKNDTGKYFIAQKEIIAIGDECLNYGC